VERLEKVYDEIEEAGGAEPAITPLDLETAVMNSTWPWQTALMKPLGAWTAW